jgi:predicted metal-dependent peptidase
MSETPAQPEPQRPDEAAREELRAEAERLVAGALIRLRTRSPFFAALALFARQVYRWDLPTAATNGRDVFWNPAFARSLQPAEVCGVLLHEVLHAALLHVARRGERDALLWNIAADIVVNGMISAEIERVKERGGLALPDAGVRDKDLEHLSVEEVYEIIRKDPAKRALADRWRDLLEEFGGDVPTLTRAELEAHWRAAQARATTLLKATGRGDLPAELARELEAMDPSRLDWRSHLWRFLVRTPTDFSGFDRRFIGRGLYLEAMEGETVRVYVAVDTSGSIGGKEMTLFLGEVMGILRAYPSVRCHLYYADAAAYGPYPLTTDTDPDALPRPVGGGGTDFRPFFAAVEKEQNEGGGGHDGSGPPLCVYLTDGYGAFPDPEPPFPTLWVVSPGGLDLTGFPFGETVRLVGN